jgi:hypothetical protein
MDQMAHIESEGDAHGHGPDRRFSPSIPMVPDWGSQQEGLHQWKEDDSADANGREVGCPLTYILVYRRSKKGLSTSNLFVLFLVAGFLWI